MTESCQMYADLGETRSDKEDGTYGDFRLFWILVNHFIFIIQKVHPAPMLPKGCVSVSQFYLFLLYTMGKY